jgi:anaerobic ribonucleoside-triphosphate reductase activating protein
MSKYNKIIKNDVVNGEGVTVSLFVQGCPHQCSGCFNPETWPFNCGEEYTPHTKWEILEAIGANNIQRNFSLLGGEPLAPQNLKMSEDIVRAVRAAYPDIKIFLWTGYTFDELDKTSSYIKSILNNIDVLVDGPFIEKEKDLDLFFRGSRNQNIWIKNIEGDWINVNRTARTYNG